MVALVVLQSLVLAVLTVLVVGLLRSHGDVLRRLHELGVPLNDDAASGPSAVSAARGEGLLDPEAADIAGRLGAGVAPPKASITVAADVSGVTPTGGAVSVAVVGRGRFTLLAFLSSGCSTCAGFWQALQAGERVAVGGKPVRLVVVTGGPEHEHPRAIANLAPPDVTVVMSAQAWQAYAVPATPYFVLVDGERGVVGEGSASGWPQLAGLLERALGDGGYAPAASSDTQPSAGPELDLRLDDFAADGRPREARVDAALRSVGIEPGDNRLYENPLDAPAPAELPG